MNRTQWNELVKKHAPPFGAFLASFEWGAFQRALGRSVERVYTSSADGEMIAQAIRHDLPFGFNYWMISKGPTGTMAPEKMVSALRQQLSDGAFLRIEPNFVSRMLKTNDVQPAATLMLDLKLGSQELLAQMKSKTRYNIRLANRKGVVCKIVGLDRFEDFVRLMEQTTHRDSFRAHPDLYYKTMLETMKDTDAQAFLAMAFYEDRPIASNIMIDFNGVRTYLHGATSNLHRNVMAQYGLHWFLIEDAVEKGMHQFDFWGIAPEGASSDHPWSGITRYKKGFGGKELSMPGTFDLPLRYVSYSLYRSIRNMRRFRFRKK